MHNVAVPAGVEPLPKPFSPAGRALKGLCPFLPADSESVLPGASCAATPIPAAAPAAATPSCTAPAPEPLVPALALPTEASGAEDPATAIAATAVAAAP